MHVSPVGMQSVRWQEICCEFSIPDTAAAHVCSTEDRVPCENRFLPKDLQIIGYARSKLTAEDLREKLKGFLKEEDDLVSDFLSRVTYISGVYDGDEGFQVSAGLCALSGASMLFTMQVRNLRWELMV